MTEEKVSAELGRLWRLPPGPQRLGRPAELDVERVVGTAVDIADREGIGGVTLPKVAAALGYTKMALYRHVGSKDELFTLMADLAIRPGPEPGGPGPEWRTGLRQWAHAQREIYREHPWLVDLPISGPPRGPNAIGWMDALLRVLRDTGLDAATKVGILNLLGGYVRQASVLAQQLEAGRRDTGLDQAHITQDYGRTLAALVDPERFPEAAKLFSGDVFETPQSPSSPPLNHEFVFGLELILDGIAATIDAP